MLNEAADAELSSLLARFDAPGGALDYVFVENQDTGASYKDHRAAALAGMSEIDRRLAQWAGQSYIQSSC